MKYEVKYDLSFLEVDLRELLKKLKKHNTYASQLENEIILYKLEIERLKESEEYHRKGYAELYKRIDEAIEYVELAVNCTPSSTRKDIANMILINHKTMLDILKGADKE